MGPYAQSGIIQSLQTNAGNGLMPLLSLFILNHCRHPPFYLRAVRHKFLKLKVSISTQNASGQSSDISNQLVGFTYLLIISRSSKNYRKR
jgi:hypothetical protein